MNEDQNDLKELISMLSCPITKKIFKTPVIANDECVYEAEIANKLLNKESPITGEIIKGNFNIAIPLLSLISNILEEMPEFKKIQYETDYKINKEYYFNKNKIISIFDMAANYESIMIYNNFDIEDFTLTHMKKFFSYAPLNIIKYFIDNCNNLERKWENDWRLLHIICRYSQNKDTLKYIIDKNVDINAKCTDGRTPLHIAGYNDNEDMVVELIDRGANLLYIDNEGITPLDIILTYHNKDFIKYTLDKIDDSIFKYTFLNPIQFNIRVDDNENLNQQDKDEILDIMDEKLK